MGRIWWQSTDNNGLPLVTVLLKIRKEPFHAGMSIDGTTITLLSRGYLFAQFLITTFILAFSNLPACCFFFKSHGSIHSPMPFTLHAYYFTTTTIIPTFSIIPKMPIKHLLEFHTTHSTNFQLPIPHHTHHCKYSPCFDPPFSFSPCTNPPLTDSTQSSIGTHTVVIPTALSLQPLFDTNLFLQSHFLPQKSSIAFIKVPTSLIHVHGKHEIPEKKEIKRMRVAANSVNLVRDHDCWVRICTHLWISRNMKWQLV